MERVKILYLARSDGVVKDNRPSSEDIGTAETHQGKEYYIPIKYEDEAYQSALKALGTAMAIRLTEMGKMGEHPLTLLSPQAF